ncbi:MAG: hypothetical protein EOM87_03875, partial [Clostridia bacterium]|nr:hypothetical protein [Clostridia bacterium]
MVIYMKSGKIIIRVVCLILASLLLVSCGSGTINESIDDSSKGSNVSTLDDLSNKNGFNLTGDTYISDGLAKNLPESLQKVSVTAAGTDGKVISADDSFIIETSGDIAAEELTQYVSLSPSVNYSVTKLSSRKFELTPASTLSSGKVYRLLVGDKDNPAYSFAFQTETQLVVKSVLPADEANNVPTNAGIEIEFTDSVYGNDFAKFISISPSVDGYFTLYPDGKTVVFVPNHGLEENKVYKVTVKKGITASSGKILEEDKIFAFRTVASKTNSSETAYFNIYKAEFLFRTDNYPVIPYSSSSDISYTITADIYKYASAYEAIQAKKAYEAVKADYFFSGDTYVYPTKGLVKVTSKSKSVQKNDKTDKYIELPILNGGVYLANITFSYLQNGTKKTFNKQVFIQISDLTIYTESCNGSTLVWVNGPDGPAKNADINGECFVYKPYWNSESVETAYTPVSGGTNADGIYILDNGSSNSIFMTASYDNQEIYACILAGSKSENSYYFNYLYTDREIYFQNDTVNFAGVIRPAVSYTNIPEKLYLKTSWSGNTYEEIEVNEDGTFKGSYEIDSYVGYGVYFRFCDKDGNILFSKYISVTDENKPVYKASLAFDKPFYSYGDTVTVTLTATFFDGTPAPYLTFELKENNFIGTKTLKTGVDGTVSFSFKTYSMSEESTYPFPLYVTAQLMGEETTSIYIVNSVMYFNTNVYYTSKRINADYSEVYLNKVDTSGITCAADATYENTIGDPEEGSVNIVLTKYEIKKRYLNTYYDPITKKSIENYDYYTDETTIKTYKEQFINGIVKLDHIQLTEDFLGYYIYTVTYHDKLNNSTYTQKIYACKGSRNEFYYYYQNNQPKYTLMTEATEYSVGDTVNAWVEYGGKKYEDKVLYTVYSEGKFHYTYTNEYSVSFDDSFVSGVKLYATLINGENMLIYSLNENLTYDYNKNSSLYIRVETDKDIYKPGETVTAKVKASSGSSAANATVILSVADEACFALGDQTVNALMEYYTSSKRNTLPIYRNNRFNDYYFQLYRIGNSTVGYYEDGMEYCEEECAYDTPNTDDSTNKSAEARIREIFKDNPVFITCTLDSNGEAVISFTMPDNITQWRITAVVLNNKEADKYSGMEIGNYVSDVICTLPYFINVSSCDRYITGDDISVSARSYGSSLTSIKPVTYSAALYDDEGVLVISLDEIKNSDEYARFNFGKLEKGTYSVVINGECGSLKDAMKTTFIVTDTGVLMNVTRDISVNEIATLDPQAYPLSLSFHDDTYNNFILVARRLMWGYSERSDTIASSYVGAAVLEKLFVWKYSEGDAKAKLSSYSGFIPLISYGEGNVELTAKICAVAPEVLSNEKKAELIDKFTVFIADKQYIDDSQLCAALLGLASLGQPVLTDLTYIASHCEDFSAEAKLYLCAAFGYIGDFSAAKNIYNALYDEYAKTADGGELYFDGGNTEKSIKLTSLALLSASLVSKLDAEKLTAYLMERNSYIDQYILELASYVKFFMPTEIKTSSFTYQIGENEEKEITLKAGSVYTLSLTKKEFKALKIISSDEAVSVRANYMGTAEEATRDKAGSSELQISKTITPYDVDRGLYKVTITYSGKTDRNYAYYTLADCIPSGARFYSAEGNYGYNSSRNYNGYAWLSNSGQMMNGGISVWKSGYDPMKGNTEYTFSGKISYIIR